MDYDVPNGWDSPAEMADHQVHATERLAQIASTLTTLQTRLHRAIVGSTHMMQVPEAQERTHNHKFGFNHLGTATAPHSLGQRADCCLPSDR